MHHKPVLDDRRHDLDALRAVAMLLGIALHVSLSLAPIPWAIQDTRQHSGFLYFFLAIHGFRMQLFFLISGYFTMMLYRKRGSIALLKQRALRIVIPCLIGMATIVPLDNWIVARSIRLASQSTASGVPLLVRAIRAGDKSQIADLVSQKTDLNKSDPQFRITPVGWATLVGDAETVSLLIQNGAIPHIRTALGNTPLHLAAELGHAEIAQILVDNGANIHAVDRAGVSVEKKTETRWDSVAEVAKTFQIEGLNADDVAEGRLAVREVLKKREADPSFVAESTPDQDWLTRQRQAYVTWIESDRFVVDVGLGPVQLFTSNHLHHLWFLWVLAAMVLGFSLVMWIGGRLGCHVPAGLPILSGWRFLWLIPITFLPQLLMGVRFPLVGPDTPGGLIGLPHTLVYYSIFFGFGAIYYDKHDSEGEVGRRWWLLLPVGLLVGFPAALFTLSNTVPNALIQVLYTWMVTFGLMGMFRALWKRESAWVRYVSDSAYWLYLMHLPFVFFLQELVREWPWPALVKFVFMNVVTVLVGLVTYEYCVRYTWIGLVLNGRRHRPLATNESPATAPAATELSAG